MPDIHGPDLTGSVWRINDSGTTFVVVNCDAQYAIVENMNPPARRRRILRSSLKTTRAKNGYTLVTGNGTPEAPGEVGSDA